MLEATEIQQPIWIMRPDLNTGIFVYENFVGDGKEVVYIMRSPKLIILTSHNDELLKKINSETISLNLESTFLPGAKVFPDQGSVSISVRDQFLYAFKLASFLDSIDMFISLKSIKQEISATLGLADDKEFVQLLLALIEQGETEEAIKKMKAVAGDEGFWKFGQFCEEKRKYQEALEIYQAIPENNTDYSKANERMSMLVDSALEAHEAGEIRLSEEEVKKYREFKIRFRLRADIGVDRPNTDKICAQFTGDSWEQPPVKKIKIDEDTVINLLKRVKDLKEENTSLRKKLALKSDSVQALSEEDNKFLASTRNHPEQSTLIFGSIFTTALRTEDNTKAPESNAGVGLNLN